MWVFWCLLGIEIHVAYTLTGINESPGFINLSAMM